MKKRWPNESRGKLYGKNGSFRHQPCNQNLCSYCCKGPHKAIYCRKRIKDEAEAKAKEGAAAAIDKEKKATSNDNSDYSLLSDFTYYAVRSIDDRYAE